MHKVLVIEDDADINRLLCRILGRAGYDTASAWSGTEAQLRLERENFDLIMLDLMLPGMSGEDVLRYVRKERGQKLPVIILSAKTGLENKVGTLTMGADDYITKPFEPQEVLARVTAVMRRCAGNGELSAKRAYTYKNLILDTQSRIVRVKQTEIFLTKHEYEILQVLLTQPDKVFSRDTLYEMVWKNGYYGEDNTVNVHVSNIRKKIAAADPGGEYIKTVWGIGFKMA